MIIWCNNIFDTNILSRGYPTKFKNYGNSRGWGGGGYYTYPLGWKFPGVGGLKQKCPPWKGCMDIVWNYTIFAKTYTVSNNPKAVTNTKKNIFSHFIAEKLSFA